MPRSNSWIKKSENIFYMAKDNYFQFYYRPEDAPKIIIKTLSVITLDHNYYIGDIQISYAMLFNRLKSR